MAVLTCTCQGAGEAESDVAGYARILTRRAADLFEAIRHATDDVSRARVGPAHSWYG